MIGLGSTTELGIGIAIQLQDQFSGTADKVLGRMQNLKDSTNSLILAAGTAYRNQSALIAAATLEMSKGFWDMAKSTSAFGHSINQVDIVGEGKLGKTKTQLSKIAQSLAGDFATKPGEVAGAMFENTKQGITKGLADITKYELAVSKATDESIGGVSNHLLHIMNAYNMTTTQFPRIANAITAAANATTASVTSIGEGMQYAAFPANQFNVRLEETLALVSKLQQAGISASGSGTALQNMFTYLGVSTSSLATKKQSEMWMRLGLNQKQMGNWVNHGKIFDVLAAIDQQLTHIAPNERAGILKSLVNVRGTRAVLGTWGNADPDKSLRGILSAIDNGVNSNIAIKQSKAMMNDPYGQFLKLQVAWENFKINFITAAAPMLMKVLKAITSFVDHVLSPIAASPIGNIFAGILGIGLPLIGALFTFRAAALTAAFALRGLAGLGGPSFGQILKAQLGQFTGMKGNNLGQMTMGGRASMGIGVMANASNGPSYLRDIAKNAAGNWYVKSGSQFHMGNQVYGAGQILPRNFNPALGGNYNIAHSSIQKNALGNWFVRAGMNYQGQNGTIYGPGQMIHRQNYPQPLGGLTILGQSNAFSNATKALGYGQTTASAASGALPLLGKIGMGILDTIPVLGQILAGITIISAVASWFMGERKQEDPEFLKFKESMDTAAFKYTNPIGGDGILGGMPFKNHMATGLTQHIHVNVDGEKAAHKVVHNVIDDSLEKYLNFNTSH